MILYKGAFLTLELVAARSGSKFFMEVNVIKFCPETKSLIPFTWIFRNKLFGNV